MGAEFVGLEDGAASQFTARQTGGKAEIVFDSHAAASLPARCGLFEYGGPQPFGCAINSRRKARRTGAHNHQVVHQILQGLPDSDRVGELPIGRIPQKQHRATGYHWRIRFGHAELP